MANVDIEWHERARRIGKIAERVIEEAWQEMQREVERYKQASQEATQARQRRGEVKSLLWPKIRKLPTGTITYYWELYRGAKARHGQHLAKDRGNGQVRYSGATLRKHTDQHDCEIVLSTNERLDQLVEVARAARELLRATQKHDHDGEKQ